MKRLCALLACLLPLSAFAHSPATGPEPEIRAVVEAFRTAIINKDKARFLGLFVAGPVTWQSVRGDQPLSQMRETDPQAPKVPLDAARNHLTFIDGIVAREARVEEKFGELRIDTDGDIASVVFDYSFHVDGRETNHGDEAWQLVRTDDGWKIVAVIWSINPARPAPADAAG
ncbi:MAG: nuclear transport factor 2 family protein [Pseudomonadota bacterium]|nr:nuclear transport factor 2 family protein [Pseudomonadota bacterium]